MKSDISTIFLDRDGVINIDSPDYIKTPEEFKFIPRSPEAVALLCKNGFDVIVITNQSLIGRGMATQQTLEAIFNKMMSGVEQAGGRIKDIFYCPHTPQTGCECRKPSPGLIRAACKKHDLTPENTIMIGDSMKDIQCARNAGCRTSILVRTGNGNTALRQLREEEIQPGHTAADLFDAARWIASRFKP